jgi:hypothetical protein
VVSPEPEELMKAQSFLEDQKKKYATKINELNTELKDSKWDTQTHMEDET